MHLCVTRLKLMKWHHLFEGQLIKKCIWICLLQYKTIHQYKCFKEHDALLIINFSQPIMLTPNNLLILLKCISFNFITGMEISVICHLCLLGLTTYSTLVENYLPIHNFTTTTRVHFKKHQWFFQCQWITYILFKFSGNTVSTNVFHKGSLMPSTYIVCSFL